ncbi:MAG: coat protein [Plant associated deltapartitivirus 2]|nr:MAG: coat protein [Plant associated deltapartitivirus 2]
MDKSAQDTETNITAASTLQKRQPTTGIPEHPLKRPTTRSNSKTATDYLLDETRIGSITHYPTKKRRYVTMYGSSMLESLFVLYTSLFKQRWSSFARSVEKTSLTGATVKTHPELLAAVYLTHWSIDVYRMIRESLLHLDPIAFNERYHTQQPVHSHIYDNFLATLCGHIRPTHVTMSYADEIYIPVMSTVMATQSGTNPFNWTKATTDHDLFQIILQTFEDRKLVMMSPIPTDLFGRHSWLFDWSQHETAYAWFPQESNYNDEDVMMAYIIGVACTPKLGHCDPDDWKLTSEATEITASRLARYHRIKPRRYKGSCEFRVAETDVVNYPALGDKDKDKFNASNKGPLQIYTDPTAAAASSTTTTDTEDVFETSTDYVPASPRTVTRALAAIEGTKVHRYRVIDYVYYRQVILNVDTTSRATAFRIMLKP